jgi:hypothetical protein
MIQGVAAISGGLDKDIQIFAQGVLADEFVQRARA